MSRWNVCTTLIVRTIPERATAAFILLKYPAAYSITVYRAHSCLAVMRLGLMSLQLRESLVIGKCRDAKYESLRPRRQVASVVIAACRRRSQECGCRRGEGRIETGTDYPRAWRAPHLGR